MKAFEVKKSIIGGYKNETKTLFVQARSKKEIISTGNIVKIWYLEDMKPEECPMEIVDGVICEKANTFFELFK